MQTHGGVELDEEAHHQGGDEEHEEQAANDEEDAADGGDRVDVSLLALVEAGGDECPYLPDEEGGGDQDAEKGRFSCKP